MFPFAVNDEPYIIPFKLRDVHVNKRALQNGVGKYQNIIIMLKIFYNQAKK